MSNPLNWITPMGIHPIGCKCLLCRKGEGLSGEELRKAIANDIPCLICGKPKGQPPDRCPGHYMEIGEEATRG